MKYLLFAFLLFASVSAFSQDQKTIYCQIVGYRPGFYKIIVQIDLGKPKGFLESNTEYLREPGTNKMKKFNSMIDALNYMSENGWKLEQVYVAKANGSEAQHYLLSMVVKKGEDGNYYPQTKPAF